MNLESYLSNVSVSISPSAAAKAQYLASRTPEMAGRDLEVFTIPLGQTLSFGDRTHIVIDDIFIPRQQKIFPAHFDYDYASINREAEEAGVADRMIGWIHSHGGMDVFHSGTDDSNLNKLLDLIPETKRLDTEGCRRRLYMVPSLVFNKRADRPHMQLYAKEDTVLYDDATILDKSSKKMRKEIDIQGIEAHAVVDAGDATKQDIDSRIREVLSYNDYPCAEQQQETSVIWQPWEYCTALLQQTNYRNKIQVFRGIVDTLEITDEVKDQYHVVIDVLAGTSSLGSCWKWQDRYALLEEYICSNADAFDDSFFFVCKSLVSSHQYLIRKHPDIVQRFDALLGGTMTCRTIYDNT
jgi:hypothetical protein